VVQNRSQQPMWRRSSRCDGGQCVEVAFLSDVIAVRDAKDPEGPVLNFDRETWAAFIASLRVGTFA
jgi:hypothetical protein